MAAALCCCHSPHWAEGKGVTWNEGRHLWWSSADGSGACWLCTPMAHPLSSPIKACVAALGITGSYSIAVPQ